MIKDLKRQRNTVVVVEHKKELIQMADYLIKLNSIIHELTSNGATVVVIKHNPKIISQADYIIEMGPKGGENGGYILKEGWLC